MYFLSWSKIYFSDWDARVNGVSRITWGPQSFSLSVLGPLLIDRVKFEGPESRWLYPSPHLTPKANHSYGDHLYVFMPRQKNVLDICLEFMLSTALNFLGKFIIWIRVPNFVLFIVCNILWNYFSLKCSLSCCLPKLWSQISQTRRKRWFLLPPRLILLKIIS